MPVVSNLFQPRRTSPPARTINWARSRKARSSGPNDESIMRRSVIPIASTAASKIP